MPVGVRDVAIRAGVSVGTVSNVLNQRPQVSPDIAKRVEKAIEQLGYIRNEAARKLRAGVSTTIGFVVLDGQNPFYNDVVRGAEDEASRHGITVLYGNSDEDVGRERAYIDLFEEQQVRGLLIAPYGDVAARLQRLRDRGIAAVLVDRFSGDGRFSSVSVDSVAGGTLAVEHLIDTGRRRIGFVGGPLAIRQVDDRLTGARIAVERAGREVALDLFSTASMSIEQGAAAGERILSLPPRRRPDAIFAANDLLALGVLQSLVMSGRMLVPDDVAIIGFDDIPFADAAAVPLSSIRQPSRMLGRTALRVVLEEAAEADSIPRQTAFTPELVVRGSTGAA